VVKVGDEITVKVIGIDAFFSEEESPAADEELAKAIKESGSVALGYFFLTSEEEIRDLREDTSPFLPQAFNVVHFIPENSREFSLREGHYMRSNIAVISEQARGLGFLNVFPDDDGTVRWVPLMMRFKGEIYPSLALQVARKYLGNPDLSLTVVNSGVERLQLGEEVIPTNERGQFLVNYRGGRSTFPSHSFSKIIFGKVPKEDFTGKIVLVGATAIGIYDARITPFEREVPGVEIHATVIDNILHRDFILRPVWTRAINIPVIILMALIPGLLIPRLSPLRGAPIAMGLFVIYMVANRYLLVRAECYSIWEP